MTAQQSPGAQQQAAAPPPVVVLSASLRVLVNAEALNMAEAVGNYVRHRKAPVVLQDSQGYSVIYVPAISGESIAHGYQLVLAKLAAQRNLPVAEADLQGYFMKFADNSIIEKYYRKELAKALGVGEGEVVKVLKDEKTPTEKIEEAILKASVVADVGGFLYTERTLKRISPVRFSYMLPAIDAVQKGGAAVLPQLHVRYTPEAARREQALYNIESGSALYTLTAEVVLSDIGRTSKGKPLQDVKQRAAAALDALIAVLDGMLFGAKKSRYMPQWKVQSLVAAVSKGPVEFVVSPGVDRNYLMETAQRAKAVSEATGTQIQLFYYNGEGLPEPQGPHKASTHTEALLKARDAALTHL